MLTNSKSSLVNHKVLYQELLDFVLSNTYFLYDGEIYIYRQIQGAMVGSPVSVVVFSLYMEDHEEKSIHSVTKEMKKKNREEVCGRLL